MRYRLTGVGSERPVSVVRGANGCPRRKGYKQQRDARRARRCAPVCRAAGLYGSTNGSTPSDEPVNPEGKESIDMFVADVDFMNPASRDTVVRVPNPRTNINDHDLVGPSDPQSMRRQSHPGGNKADIAPSTSRALRIESAWSAAELKNRNRELAKAKLEISMKDKEIGDLKRKLTQREQSLRYSKAELIEARMVIQKKDEQLRQTYESLVTSARERSKLREELISVEKELMDARDELHHWTNELVELKTEIDNVDEDGEMDRYDYQPSQNPNSMPERPPVGLMSAVDLLEELKDLSSELLVDAKQDEQNLRLPGDW